MTSMSGLYACCSEGDFETSFTEADNSKLLPTDTMKNTVYSIARDSKATTLEEFAIDLGDYLLKNNPQVSGVLVEIEEKAWERMIVDGSPEATTFKLGGPEVHTVRAVRDQGREWSIRSGVDGLVILKTTKSGVYRLHQGQADHAQASDGPHLRHACDGGLGLCR